MRTLREFGVGKLTMEDYIIEEINFCSDYLRRKLKEVSDDLNVLLQETF